VLALRGSPWFDHLVVDPEYYDAWARRIATGDWLGERAFYMDPLYPYVLGALYRLCGRDLLLARLLNVAFAAGTIALVARIGRRVGGARTGILAAFAFALYAPDIFYVGEVDKTTLSIFLTAAALALAVGHARFAGGLALGAAALTRANLLVTAPVLALARGRRATLFAVGLACILVPVAWRNHRVSGEWVLTTTQAGQNFYTGNNELNPWGAYGAVPFVRGNPHFEEADFRAEAERRAGRSLAPREVSRFWFAEAFRHVRAHPGFALRATIRKAALFWNDFEISDNQDQYLLERVSWVLRLPLVGFGWLPPLALLGAIAVRRTRAVGILVAFVAVYCASVVAFFVFSRYRIQIVPALLPLAALGLLDLAARVRAGAWRPVATRLVIVAAVAAFTFHGFDVFSRDDPQASEMRLRHLADMEMDAGHIDRALAAYDEAVRGCPLRCTDALADLTTTYLRSGRAADAERYLRAFAAAYPEQVEARRQLERVRGVGGN
jgi:4-amino-4-deoxy-L-arabinose transferase-like glycosyltransferase